MTDKTEKTEKTEKIEKAEKTDKAETVAKTETPEPDMGTAATMKAPKKQRQSEVSAETLAEIGVVPREDAALLRAHAGFDVDRIFEIEELTRHDVIAFHIIRCVK